MTGTDAHDALNRWLVISLIAVFSAVAIYYGFACYLTPDEATFYPNIAASDWSRAYAAARRHPHPPLWPLLLSLISTVATDAGVLRLASVIAVAFGAWMLYRFILLLAGGGAALAGTAFALSSFSLLAMATEVRPYPGMFLSSAAALLCAEHWVRGRSQSYKWLIGLTLALAAGVLSHFSTAMTAITLAVYVGTHLIRSEAGRGRLPAWIASQLAVAAVAYWAFFVHSERFSERVTGGSGLWWVRAGMRGDESMPHFLARGWGGIWRYFESSDGLALLAALLFAAGVIALAWQRYSNRDGESRWLEAATAIELLLLPFVFGLGLAAARLYPASESRHVSYLLPFAAAGVGIGVATLLRQNRLAIASLSVVAVAASLFGRTPNNDPRIYAPAHVDDALAYFTATVPAGETVFVDDQTIPAMAYYLRDRSPLTEATGARGTSKHLAGVAMVRVRPHTWLIRPRGLQARVGRTAKSLGYRAGDPVWVITTGWRGGAALHRGVRRDQILEYREFGEFRFLHMKLAAPRGDSDDF